MPESPEDPLEATRMSLGEHLEELRVRLARGLIAVGIAFLVGWLFRQPIQVVVLRPLEQSLEALRDGVVAQREAYLEEHPGTPRTEFFLTDDPDDRRLAQPIDTRPMQTGVTEGVFFTVRIVFYFALFVGAPVLLWQMWQFVAAGLYPHERKLVLSGFPYSVALFLAGVVFGYFVLVPLAMYFLIGFIDIELVRPEIKLSEYFSLLSALSLAIGLVFQLPLAMLVGTKAGLLRVEKLRAFRSYFVVAACIFAAFITPPDPYTMLLLAVPTVLLYEIGILLAARAERKAAAELRELSLP